MKRILILSPYPDLPGGVNNYVTLLTDNLNYEKFEIKLFFTGKTDSSIKNVFYPFLILNQYYKLRKVIKNFNPNLIHINPSLSSTAIIRDFIFLKKIKKCNVPVLFFIHGWRDSIAKKFHSSIFKNYFKKRLAMTDAIIVLAEDFKEELIDLGIYKDKIFVSSTMVESEKYNPIVKEFKKPYTVLFCATMKRNKGPFTVLNSIPKVLTKYPETKFLFIGSGRDLNELKEKTKDMNLDKNVHFSGYISEEEKQEYFKNSQIFVFPTKHGEGFPTVILEAMAAGMPLITTSVAGLKDALEEGKQGFIIDLGSQESEEVSQKIIQLMENEDYMKQISINNMNEAKEKYDVKVVTSKIENIYKKII